MRTVAYLRVSTNEQSTTHQREAAERWAGAQGVDVEYFDEPGVSGCAAKRPVLEEVVRLCRTGGIGTLWVWELSRLGRSLVGVVSLMNELHQLGVRVVVSKEGIDYGTPVGRLLAHVMASLAEFERANLRDRVRSGMDATIEPSTGKRTRTRSRVPVGRPAFCWTDESGREALETFRALRACGASWSEVLRYAKETPVLVFRPFKGADGKVDHRASVPGLTAIRSALATTEVMP